MRSPALKTIYRTLTDKLFRESLLFGTGSQKCNTVGALWSVVAEYEVLSIFFQPGGADSLPDPLVHLAGQLQTNRPVGGPPS